MAGPIPFSEGLQGRRASGTHPDQQFGGGGDGQGLDSEESFCCFRLVANSQRNLHRLYGPTVRLHVRAIQNCNCIARTTKKTTSNYVQGTLEAVTCLHNVGSGNERLTE